MELEDENEDRRSAEPAAGLLVVFSCSSFEDIEDEPA